MYQPKTLHQRNVVYVILPVFLFLTFTGVLGFRALRGLLIDQWGEVVLAKLENAAHSIDMQLKRPKMLLALLDGIAKEDVDKGAHELIIDRLRKVEGVVEVNAQWPDRESPHGLMMLRRKKDYRPDTSRPPRTLEATPPLYEVELDEGRVLLASRLINRRNEVVGKVEVYLAFEELIAETTRAIWWNSYRSYIVDSQGHILTQSTKGRAPRNEYSMRRLLGADNELEHDTLSALLDKESGIVFGKGHPPEEISGFFRLAEAPWTMVLVAPGETALEAIVKFRITYYAVVVTCIVALLLFIRAGFANTTRSIREVSQAADRLANGTFSKPLQVTTRDEVGDLQHSFNRMTDRLKKGMELQKAMEIAREVQMKLLPGKGYSGHGITASGISIYCDETGGDYFDFIESEIRPGKLHVAVGDVVGHGVGAALLMTTLRALVRVRVQQPGDPGERVADVNRYLCLDTLRYGNFSTLFYLEIDPAQHLLEWVRAGHDPALLYTPSSDVFVELLGRGLVLGLEADIGYGKESMRLGLEKQIIIIGSDGLWEVENADGERFGRDRVKELIRKNHQLRPSKMVKLITDTVQDFMGRVEQADDITLVVIVSDPETIQVGRDGVEEGDVPRGGENGENHG